MTTMSSSDGNVLDAEAGEPAGLLAELLAAEPGELTDGEVSDGVLALARLVDRVDAALTAFASVLDTRAIHTADGARSLPAWMASRADVSRQGATAIAWRGRKLRSCPHVAAAHRAGVLSGAKVRMLLQARRQVEECFAEHEAGLVEHLRPLTVAHAAIAVARWRQKALEEAGIDPDRSPTDPSENTLHLSRTLGGRWAISGDADAETGALLHAAITAEVDARFRSGTYRADDDHTPGRRRLATLTDLVLGGAVATTSPGCADIGAEPTGPVDADADSNGNDDGDGDGSTDTTDDQPTTGPASTGVDISVVIDAATLAHLAALDPADAATRRSELADGTPIPVTMAERLLCGASITEVHTRTAPDGLVDITGVTIPARHANRTQRRALAQRDGGCVYPGCDAPPTWCEAHHLTPWAEGGATTLGNLALLCRFHHHACHEGGHRIVRDTDGHVVATRPDGTVLSRPSPGHLVVEPGPPDPPRPGEPPWRVPSRFRPLVERLTAAERAERRERAVQAAQIRARVRALLPRPDEPPPEARAS